LAKSFLHSSFTFFDFFPICLSVCLFNLLHTRNTIKLQKQATAAFREFTIKCDHFDKLLTLTKW
jgi:hypothetical protein